MYTGCVTCLKNPNRLFQICKKIKIKIKSQIDFNIISILAINAQFIYQQLHSFLLQVFLIFMIGMINQSSSGLYMYIHVAIFIAVKLFKPYSNK